MTHTACILGASGAVGSQLLDLLLSDARYAQVCSIGRRTLPIEHPKLTQVVSDFSDATALHTHLRAQHVFVCVGTTIAKAGSQDNFRKVDYDIPVMVSNVLKNSQFDRLVVISSIGAGSLNRGFYLRTKTEMETALQDLLGTRLRIVRPSLLLGPRSEKRLGEDIGKMMHAAFSFLFVGKLLKYKGIRTSDVARAMIKIAFSDQNQQIFESDELQRIAENE